MSIRFGLKIECDSISLFRFWGPGSCTIIAIVFSS
jgi:hypothetical protein